jgi:hypothetical protein
MRTGGTRDDIFEVRREISSHGNTRCRTRGVKVSRNYISMEECFSPDVERENGEVYVHRPCVLGITTMSALAGDQQCCPEKLSYGSIE